MLRTMWSWRALGFGLSVTACSGGYPLAPTRCDEWCDATKAGNCVDDYDPAGCVSTCEATGVSHSQCAQALDALIACYRRNPQELTLQCNPSVVTPCSAERFAIALCTGAATAGKSVE